MTMKFAAFATPDIRRLMEQIDADESAFESEARVNKRIKLIRPIEVTSNGTTYQAFSRDVSTGGICLFSSVENELENECAIRILNTSHEYNLNGTCRWKSKFGANHWISGWQLDQELDVEKIESEEVYFDPENRQSSRRKVAIPVEIKGKGTTTHSFSLNMTGVGICLVTDSEITHETYRLLKLTRRDCDSCEVVAQCQWSRPFGDSHWVSGWQYPRLDRTQRFYRQMLS